MMFFVPSGVCSTQHDGLLIFCDIKFNQAYTRCRLRGQEKVNIEVGLLRIAHTIKKVALWLN